jgi:ribosomal protein S27E
MWCRFDDIDLKSKWLISHPRGFFIYVRCLLLGLELVPYSLASFSLIFVFCYIITLPYFYKLSITMFIKIILFCS